MEVIVLDVIAWYTASVDKKGDIFKSDLKLLMNSVGSFASYYQPN